MGKIQEPLATETIESANSLCWKGTLKLIQPNPPAMSRDIFNHIKMLRAPSNLALSVSRAGASPTSLGNLCQGFTTLSMKNFFLISSLNLPSFSLEPLPLVPKQGVGGVDKTLHQPCGVCFEVIGHQ